MSISDLIESLQIFQKYESENKLICLSSEHDEFYVYRIEKIISDEDVQKLIDLRWFQNEVKLEGGEEFGLLDYDPKEGWMHFV